MDGPSSQLDLYSPPNDYQISLRIMKTLPTNQTLIGANFFGLPYVFHNSSFIFVQEALHIHDQDLI